MPTWKYLFSSLYSNQTIIDERKRPWYWAVIFFVLSTILMVIPILSKGFTDSGNAIINPLADNYIGNGLDALGRNDEFDSLYILKEGDVYKLGAGDAGQNVSFEQTPFYVHTNIDKADDNKGKGDPISTDIYFEQNMPKFKADGSISDETETVRTLAVYSTSLDIANDDVYKTAVIAAIEEKITKPNIPNEENQSPKRSFILFSPSGFLIFSYPAWPFTPKDDDGKQNAPTATKSASSAAVFRGIFDAKFAKLLNSDGKYKFGDNLKSPENSINAAKPLESDYYKKWSAFLTTSYLTLRNVLVWINFGMILGATIGAIILAGLFIWLVTLGRRNILHGNCTVWQGLKMGATLSFTCAVIGMAVCFYNPTTGLLVGVMALVMRTMFLIMKTTGAGRNNAKQNKPLYQAR